VPQDTNNDGEYNVATSSHYLNPTFGNTIFIRPNLIGDVDANNDTDGRYLANTGLAIISQNSGFIPNGTDKWVEFGDKFTPTATQTIVTIRVINKQNIDGNGNDIGIDNIFLSRLECDFDRDGIPNSEDLDSDNDGIYDIVENGAASLDTDGDGRVDGGVDANGSPTGGITSIVTQTPDGDTQPDFLDIDSDGDGIPDNIEGKL